jgi:hypothetical protein
MADVSLLQTSSSRPFGSVLEDFAENSKEGADKYLTLKISNIFK